jgi:hypothetical protein
MRFIAVGAVVLISVALGYFVRDYIDTTATTVISVPFPDMGHKPSSLDLGCTSLLVGAAYENRFDHTADVRVERAPTKLALRISPDKKKAYVLYAFDVENGATEPIELNVESATEAYIIAHGQQIVGSTNVILDMQTYKAIINYTGQGMLGIKGGSVVVQCR